MTAQVQQDMLIVAKHIEKSRKADAMRNEFVDKAYDLLCNDIHSEENRRNLLQRVWEHGFCTGAEYAMY